MTDIAIDANIARSCKNPAENKVAADCYLFLASVSDAGPGTGAVVDPQLMAEWVNHGNQTFNKWFANMESKGRVRHVKSKKSSDYRRSINAVADPNIQAAMLKDVHLVELALFGQHPVASCDEKQRRYVRDLISVHALLGDVQWVNPVTDTGWTAWVERGCDRQSYTLRTTVEEKKA